MFVPPADFDEDMLARVLRTDWGIEAASLAYDPVGFGTHHYRAVARDGRCWFVNVDELADKPWLGRTDDEVLDGLARSLGTAAALAEAGLEFVHPPVRRTAGDFIAAAGAFAVSVFPLLVGTAGSFGEVGDADLRRRVLAGLGRMHAATGRIPGDLPRRDAPTVINRAEYGEALTGDWSDGPYARRARDLVLSSRGRVDEMFQRFDALLPAVLSTSDDWVVTHGEPHAGNIMSTADGFALIDWDTVLLAPRERDLWLLPPRDAAEWSAYALVDAPDPAALEIYKLVWHLSEICGYAVQFRAPHVDDDNTRIAWRSLASYLS